VTQEVKQINPHDYAQFSGSKIRMIKFLRDDYPWLGLADAKAIVESWFARGLFAHRSLCPTCCGTGLSMTP